MRRALHVLLIGAILPGVLLPNLAAFCFCDRIGCGACTIRPAPAPAPPAPKRACCGTHDASARDRHAPRISSLDACHGCVVVAPVRPTTPRPDDPASIPQDLATPPMPSIEEAEAMLALILTPQPEALAQAPPLSSRSLPLLI